MKLTSAQLESHLATTLAPVYVVSGEEFILKQDAMYAIRQAAKKAGFQERTRITQESDFSEDQLYSLIYSASLFAEKRVIELDFRLDTPPKSTVALLQAYAENPPADTLLIINMGKADDKVTRSAWYKALDSIGVTLPVWPIARDQLGSWIQQRARKYKLQFQADAIPLLIDYVEGNLVAAAQTLEKIYLLQPQKIIDKDLLQALLTDESHFTVFDLTDSLIAGDQARALHVLAMLQASGVEPVLILWSITRELRTLAEMADQAAQGVALQQVFQRQRIFARRQGPMMRFLKKVTVADCWRYLSEAAEIDRLIKGAGEGNVWQRLQLFCLRMA